MSGYSKMSTDLTSKSRSVDLSDLTFSPPHPHENPDPTSIMGQQHRAQDHLPWLKQEEGEGGESFGVILNRSCSSASQRFRGGERSHGSRSTSLQSVVKRAFSMRKSSSVAEGYWRIHDTGDGGKQEQQQGPSRKKRGKILGACKRLLGI